MQRALDVHTSTGLRDPRLPEGTVESNQLTQFQAKSELLMCFALSLWGPVLRGGI